MTYKQDLGKIADCIHKRLVTLLLKLYGRQGQVQLWPITILIKDPITRC